MYIEGKIKEALSDKLTSWEERSPKKIFFSIDKKDIVSVTKLLFKDIGLRFATASGIQTKDGFEVIYHFCLDKTGAVYSARVLLDKNNPEIDSITPLFNGAEWIEREMWELLGINFKGHPNLKRLLLADDWPEGNHPMRKSSEG